MLPISLVKSPRDFLQLHVVKKPGRQWPMCMLCISNKQTNKTQPKEYGVLDLFSPSLGNDISTDLFCSPIMCENSSSIQQGYTQGHTQGHSINVRGLTVNEYTFLIKKTGS